VALKKRGLGKGLDALLGPVAKAVETDEHHVLDEIPVEWIKAGKYQPRKEFDEESLLDLSASIKAQGIMQPIVVRPVGKDQYEIIAGERRWRAAQLAELEKIPAVIRDVDDEAAVAMSLIENIQREDLNPLEQSRALQRLIEEFDLTHQQVADAVGKSRTAVTNLLRLLSLSPGVIRLLVTGDIEMGHARALLTLDDIRQEKAAREIASKQLSVRQAESLVRRIVSEDQGQPAKKTKKVDADTRGLEDRLSQKLGQSVSIQVNSKGKGKLTIKYSSLDELDGILERFGDLDQ
jgi:ParB family transcriptional regulator, chromosome partitioning protein